MRGGGKARLRIVWNDGISYAKLKSRIKKNSKTSEVTPLHGSGNLSQKDSLPIQGRGLNLLWRLAWPAEGVTSLLFARLFGSALISISSARYFSLRLRSCLAHTWISPLGLRWAKTMEGLLGEELEPHKH